MNEDVLHAAICQIKMFSGNVNTLQGEVNIWKWKMKKLGMFFLNPDKATQKRILARMNNQLCKEDDFTGHMLNDQVSLTLRCYLQKKKFLNHYLTLRIFLTWQNNF